MSNRNPYDEYEKYEEKYNANLNKGLEIAKEKEIKIPQKFATRNIINRRIANDIIKKWGRKKFKRNGKTFWNTYCGQFTSDFFIKAGYDMGPILKGKSLWEINTTGQYKNALESVKTGNLIEITAEEAYYLALIARFSLVLSPKSMVAKDKNGKDIKYNHAALVVDQWSNVYDPANGPVIFQQGWKPLKDKHVNHKYAWGDNWDNPMVKYFLPGIM